MKASREYQVDEEGHNNCDNHYLEKSSRDLSPFHPDLHFVHHPDLSQVLHNGHDEGASDSFHYRTIQYGLINCETRSAEAQSVVSVANICATICSSYHPPFCPSFSLAAKLCAGNFSSLLQQPFSFNPVYLLFNCLFLVCSFAFSCGHFLSVLLSLSNSSVSLCFF